MPSDAAGEAGDPPRKVKMLRTKLAAEGDETIEHLDVRGEIDENGLATILVTYPDGSERVMELQLDPEDLDSSTEVDLGLVVEE